ncbi:hypothetical protein IC620_07895 [Hazenella sp. IB182357]|uniref:Uncharacterized protein n=1 Tax=Polycladospora coralii TaxID=2771432 RepID=A0A926NA72_9BACL|nr:hypothetical protein [Polycladospora coralii]MBD1372282.1 hypothetical protein [Polycladospora coralii]
MQKQNRIMRYLLVGGIAFLVASPAARKKTFQLTMKGFTKLLTIMNQMKKKGKKDASIPKANFSALKKSVQTARKNMESDADFNSFMNYNYFDLPDQQQESSSPKNTVH